MTDYMTTYIERKRNRATISERHSQHSHKSFGGWTMTWERVINGQRYEFSRSFVKGRKPYVYFSVCRHDGSGSWVQVHRYTIYK